MDPAEIQRAIEALLPREQQALLRWLEDRDNARWDAEMERDFSAGGRGTHPFGSRAVPRYAAA